MNKTTVLSILNSNTLKRADLIKIIHTSKINLTNVHKKKDIQLIMLYTQLRGCMIWNGLLKIQVSFQLIKDLRCLVLLI